jgi:hypothetical protein
MPRFGLVFSSMLKTACLEKEAQEALLLLPLAEI